MNYILVVDDSPIDRLQVTRLLERHFNCAIECAVNGWEAIEQIESHLPIAVITDLQMPEMDGLQLTDHIRRHHGTVPVILMTAFGSEDLAVEALARGAADYVPKANLANELCAAVQNALDVSVDTYREQRLHDLVRYESVIYEVNNDPSLIPPLVKHVQQLARRMGLVDDADAIRLAKALSECLRNAIYHGDLELSAAEMSEAKTSAASREAVLQRRKMAPWSDRHVWFTSTISPEEGRFVIRDEGPGFDTKSLPDIRHDPALLAGNEHRGLILIRAFMDEVSFNERGNEITCVKHKRLAAQAPSNVAVATS